MIKFKYLAVERQPFLPEKLSKTPHLAVKKSFDQILRCENTHLALLNSVFHALSLIKILFFRSSRNF